MKFSLPSISSIRTHLLSSGRAFSPQRDWSLILFFGLALFLALVVWNVVLFVSIVFGVPLTQERVGGTDATGDLLIRIEKVEERFQTRKEAYNAILSSPYPFADPSR